MDPVAARLFVCYVPGFDPRRISGERTPFVEQLVGTRPTAEVETMLGTDFLPTIVTGVYPHEHRLWQVSLRPEARIPRPLRLTDRLPGIVSTTLQEIRHMADRSFHLPSVPARRRRRFDIQRASDRSHARGARALESLGGYPTVFGMIPDSRFLYGGKFGALERLADTMPSAQCTLEFLEVHALDRIQHWHMDSPARLDSAYRATDDFIRGLHERCEQRGVTLMVLAGHGQEPVFGAIPLVKTLRAARVAEADYNYFIETTLARFWFHTEETRARLTHVLLEVPHTRILSLRDLRSLHILFEDDAYGEVYLSADPGWIFFPNDLYHPVSNLVLGLIDSDQRPRLSDPRPRGAHGYLPGHPSERGFAIVADPRFRVLRPAAQLIDLAPTLLTLLGGSPPAHMRGQSIFG